MVLFLFTWYSMLQLSIDSPFTSRREARMDTIIIHQQWSQYRRSYEPILPSSSQLIRGRTYYSSQHERIPYVADTLPGIPGVDVSADEKMIFVTVNDVEIWGTVEQLVIQALIEAFLPEGTPCPEILHKNPL